MTFSDTQIDYLINSQHDINLCSGAIRSGKTHVQIIRAIDFITGNESIPGVDILCIGKTGEALERNFLREFLRIAEENAVGQHFEYTRMPREIKYTPKNIHLICVGANDESAESKIRGMTAQAMIGDEVSLWPKSIFYQAIGRCSAGKRYKFMTCNPDAPSHYLHTDVMQNNDLDCKVWHFGLLDNPSLDEKFKQELRSLYTGIYAERFLEGKWVLAEGTVYDKFNRKEHVKETYPKNQITTYLLGIDWGYENPLAIGLIGVDYDSTYWLIDEIYVKHQLIDETLKSIMVAKGWYDLGKKITYAYADPSRPDYINLFYRITGITTLPAINDVVTGIQHVQRKLVPNRQGRCGLYILNKCHNFLGEIESYTWAPMRSGIQKDEPLKVKDHMMDMLRYCLNTYDKGRVKLLQKNPFQL
jgi:PBSX family phage terminase large subunit